MFGFCITHILNTGCAKIWKKKVRRQKVKRMRSLDAKLIKWILIICCLDMSAALNWFCSEVQGNAFMKAVINITVQYTKWIALLTEWNSLFFRTHLLDSHVWDQLAWRHRQTWISQCILSLEKKKYNDINYYHLESWDEENLPNVRLEKNNRCWFWDRTSWD